MHPFPHDAYLGAHSRATILARAANGRHTRQFCRRKSDCALFLEAHCNLSRRQPARENAGLGWAHTMIPALMLTFSCAALVQFFMSYCRSLLLSYAEVELSAATREFMGIHSAEVTGSNFYHLLGLARLAPGLADDKWEIRVVSLYYRIVRVASLLSKPIGSAAQSWVENQSNLCAYFAAAALDRRIAAVTTH